MFKEALYSIIPIFFLFFAKQFSSKQVNVFFKTLILSILFVVLFGILELLDFPLPSSIAYALEKNGKANFMSYYSAILMGYVAQLMFAMSLFNVLEFKSFYRLLSIVFFLVISVMTLQRSSYLGICVSTSVFLLSAGKTKIRTKLLISFVCLGIIYFMLNIDLSNAFGFDFALFFFDEITNFNYRNVMDDRASQAIISNVNNTFNIIFGEGFSKFSPNNVQTVRSMPDASYHRIFNELGIIGGTLFFIPFIIIMKRIVNNQNWFMLYFTSFTLLAFYFNRVLWAVPLNFIIYSIIGISQNANYKKYSRT